jgi:hypothetical protein
MAEQAVVMMMSSRGRRLSTVFRKFCDLFLAQIPNPRRQTSNKFPLEHWAFPIFGYWVEFGALVFGILHANSASRSTVAIARIFLPESAAM